MSQYLSKYGNLCYSLQSDQNLCCLYSVFTISYLAAVLNPDPAEPGYSLPLQTGQIQIRWLLKKPTDLDLHHLPLSMFLFVLRFYGPVNPMGSCRARSVYLTTHLLGRLSPLSG